MDEQSHKEAMRAAVRGDFERLRARQRRVPSAQPQPEPRHGVPAGGPRIVLTPVTRPAAEAEPAASAPLPEAPAETSAAVDVPPEPSSWLRALRRRRLA